MHGYLAEDFEETGTFKSLDGHTYYSHERPAVMTHYNRGIKICRINPIQVDATLISYDGKQATEDEEKTYFEIAQYYKKQVWEN